MRASVPSLHVLAWNEIPDNRTVRLVGGGRSLSDGDAALMKIKRYAGADMRHALRGDPRGAGADAVILSTRPPPQGVEVSAAVDLELAAGQGTLAETAALKQLERTALQELEREAIEMAASSAAAARAPSVAAADEPAPFGSLFAARRRQRACRRRQPPGQ